MKCSPMELKDYFLGELAAARRTEVEIHVEGCPGCREELERLQATGAVLMTLREEEIPQRIAFVSDPIFEPSPVRRWLSAFWGSGARLGFASAAMLSVSMVYFAASRPAPAPNFAAVAPIVASTAPAAAQIQQQIDQAVKQAVAAVEARQTEQTKQLVADFERRNDDTLRSVRWMAGEVEANRKRAQVVRAMAMVQPGESGDVR